MANKHLCVVSCPIDTFSGYGARSRDFVRALIKVKGEEWDIKIAPQRWGSTPFNFLKADKPEDKDLLDRFVLESKQQPDIWFQITVPNEFHPVGKFNIGVTAGIESTVPPPEWIEGCNRVHLNLVSSKFTQQNFSKAQFEKKDKQTDKVVGMLKLEKPIETLFEGLDIETYYKEPKISGLLKDVKEDFAFLFTGHWLQGAFGEDRKNVGLLIRTFLETFKNKNKQPALVLKCNSADYSILDKEDILNKIKTIKSGMKGSFPNVYLLHGEITDDEMNALNNDPKIKCFVSFTKGEGFGRPLLEAAITGKPTIVSNWSGHCDFMSPDYNILIGGELKNIHESAANNMLLKEAQWFNINYELAGRAMKDVYKHYKKYLEKSRKQTQYIKDNFTFDKMANLLKDYLDKAIPDIPVQTQLKLPKLKKIGDENGTPELPKLDLPKLDLPKLKLPKLKKIE